MTQNSKPIIVQKYGGSSLATPEHVRRIAENVIRRKDDGVNLVVVVSAMGKTTDQYVKMAHEVNPNPDRREMDMLLSVGERVSISMLALAINATGKYQAVSYTGSQIGLITDTNHTNARVLEVKGHRLREALAEDKIVVIAGFQGVSVNKEITTLGRGGSDTTAVAVAAAIDAEACEIMSDIDGIYTSDPRLVSTARRIDRIDYDQALEMAAAGAKMLHKTSVEFAKRHNVTLSLGSSATGNIGTIVTSGELDQGAVTGVVLDRDVAVVRFSIKDTQGHQLPLLFSRERIELKVWQCVQGLGVLAVAQSDLGLAQRFLESRAQTETVYEQAALLSIIGAHVGLGSQAAEQFLEIIDEEMLLGIVFGGELFLRALLPLDRCEALCGDIHRHFLQKLD